MTYQLPAHLQGRAPDAVTARAAAGMGGSLPPHVSIMGNTFTFVDAGGNEAAPLPFFNGIVLDVSENLNKRFYDRPYDPNASTYEPPVCWSANGVGPSREATKPQAATCEMCPQNQRGSAVSKISGAPIKACRDERWIAIMVPEFNNMIFQLVITPGSFKNWKAYIDQLMHYGWSTSWVYTRFAFQPKVNGVLTFELAASNGQPAFVSPELLAYGEQFVAERKSDVFVGRNDSVRTDALPAPTQQAALPAPAQQGSVSAAAPQPAFAPQPVPAQQGFASQPMPPAASQPGFGHAAYQQPQQGFAPAAPQQAAQPPMAALPAPAQAAPVPEATAPKRRRGRPAAGTAPEAAGVPQAAQFAPPATQAPQFAPQAPMAAPVAPFAPQPAPVAAPFAPPQQAAPATPPPGGQSFGIGGGAPVNAEVSAMLSGLFTQQQGAV